MLFLANPAIRDIVRRNFDKTGRSGLRSHWNLRFRRHGRIILAEWLPNIIHDDGEEWIAKVVFSEAQAVGANYYIGLDARTTLAEADDLAALVSEPSAGGYARQAVASDATDFTVTQVGGDWQAKTKTVTFTASGGNFGTLKNAFLTDKDVATTGKFLIASVALSADRTINDGDSLDVDLTFPIKEAA